MRKREKLRLRSRARRCHYCGVGLRETQKTLDHVQPRTLGGVDRRKNVVIACPPCNRLKAGMSLGEFAELVRTSTDPGPAAFRARANRCGSRWWERTRG